jgi:hypothetical protein
VLGAVLTRRRSPESSPVPQAGQKPGQAPWLVRSMGARHQARGPTKPERASSAASGRVLGVFSRSGPVWAYDRAADGQANPLTQSRGFDPTTRRSVPIRTTLH